MIVPPGGMADRDGLRQSVHLARAIENIRR